MGIQSVSLAGFILHGTSAGGQWYLTSNEGWNDSADVRRDRVGKAAQDGAWPSSGYFDGRSVTLQGQALFTDPAVAKAAARSLTALLGGSRDELTIEDSGGALTSLVELDGRMACEFVGDLRFRWTVPLFAPDHLKYGAPVFTQASLSGTAAGTGLIYPLSYPLDYGVAAGVTPGAVSLPNAGTAGYWPRLRIDGPVPNPVVSLVESGDWMKFTGTVAAGQWLDVDTANRRVLLNGQVSVRQNVTSSGSWLRVPPGGGSVSWTADGADPDALLSVWGYEGAWT